MSSSSNAYLTQARYGVCATRCASNSRAVGWLESGAGQALAPSMAISFSPSARCAPHEMVLSADSTRNWSLAASQLFTLWIHSLVVLQTFHLCVDSTSPSASVSRHLLAHSQCIAPSCLCESTQPSDLLRLPVSRLVSPYLILHSMVLTPS